MRVISDETLDVFAKHRLAEGLTLEQAMADIPQEDRDALQAIVV